MFIVKIHLFTITIKVILIKWTESFQRQAEYLGLQGPLGQCLLSYSDNEYKDIDKDKNNNKTSKIQEKFVTLYMGTDEMYQYIANPCPLKMIYTRLWETSGSSLIIAEFIALSGGPI